MEITLNDIRPLIPQLVVLGTALLVLLVDAFWPKIQKRIVSVLALAGLVGTGVAQVLLWPEEPATVLAGLVAVDGFSAFFLLLLTVGTALSLLLAQEYLEREQAALGEYYALVLLTAFGGMVMAAATNLIVLFIALEILSISLYILAGYHRERRVSQEAALKYFLLGAFASAFFLYGIALIYGYTGSVDLREIAQVLSPAAAAAADNRLLLAGISLLLVGFGFKVAAVPFHIWTPDVYEGAPTPVTAFMAVAAKAAGFAALVRVFTVAFPGLEVREQVGAVAASIAMLTMVVGNFVAIMQANVKRLLAYSSIAHAGYLMVGVVALLRHPFDQGPGISAVLYYSLAYTFMSLGAFGVVLAFRRQGEELLNVDDYAGLGFRHPWLAGLMTLFMLSLAGLPPTAGFFAKFYIVRAAVDQYVGLIWLPVALVLTSVVAFFYYVRIVMAMYMRPEPEDAPPVEARVGPFLGIGLAAAAAGTLVLGILPAGALEAAQNAAQSLIEFTRIVTR